MTKTSSLVALGVVILLAIAANTWISLHANAHTNAQQRALHITQHQLAQTTRESTAQRVITVSQRCHLTMLILEVLGKDDPRRVPAFQRSYNGCERQLVIVTRIAAQAP